MIITDLSQTTPINKSINLKDSALHTGIADCCSIITTGTFSGVPKLTVSQNGTDFYPLCDEDNNQITLETGKIIFLNFANLFIKVDLTGVTSNDLKVSIQ